MQLFVIMVGSFRRECDHRTVCLPAVELHPLQVSYHHNRGESNSKEMEHELETAIILQLSGFPTSGESSVSTGFRSSFDLILECS